MWLFEVDGNVENEAHLLEPKKEQGAEAKTEEASSGQYQLKAVVIHLGKSVHSGHYVAYVRKQIGWVLFND